MKNKMSEQCERTRQKLLELVTGALARSEQKEIADHLAGCVSCSDYEKALRSDDERLKTWAGEIQTSIAGIEGRIMEALESRSKTKPVESRSKTKPASSGSVWRWIVPRNSKQYMTAGVAAAAVILVLSYFLGVFEGSTPALADVLEKINETKSVSYQESYNIEGTDPFTTKVMAVEPGLVRDVLPSGSVTIWDYNTGKSLHLYPAAKKAVLTQRTGLPERKQPYNYLDWIRTLHKNSGVFARKGLLDEKEMNVFVIEHDEYEKTTVWADVETDLPVRIEYVAIPNPNKNIVVPEIALSEADFGGSPTHMQMTSRSGGSGINKRKTIVKDHFSWNVAFEDSLFQLTPPEGYTLEEKQEDASWDEEKELVEALALSAEIAGNTFPERINDLCDIDKVRPLLVAKFDKGGKPEDELEQAMAAANKLVDGLYFAQEKKAEGTWYYAGAEVRFGDAKAPLCWWRPEDSNVYRVIYGDLHVADVNAADLPDAGRQRE